MSASTENIIRYLFSVISGGEPHTAMLGYADLLTHLQRALLVQYVRYFAEPAERQRLECRLQEAHQPLINTWDAAPRIR